MRAWLRGPESVGSEKDFPGADFSIKAGSLAVEIVSSDKETQVSSERDLSDCLGPMDRDPVGSSNLDSGNSVSSRVGVHDLNEVPLGLANIGRDIDELAVI